MQVKIINKQEYVNELAFLMNYQEGIKSIEFKDYYISLDKEKDYKLVIISSILGIVLMVLIIIFRCKRKFK